MTTAASASDIKAEHDDVLAEEMDEDQGLATTATTEHDGVGGSSSKDTGDMKAPRGEDAAGSNADTSGAQDNTDGVDQKIKNEADSTVKTTVVKDEVSPVEGSIANTNEETSKTPATNSTTLNGLSANQNNAQAALLNSLAAQGISPNLAAVAQTNPEIAKAMLGIPGMAAVGLQGTFTAANNQNLLQQSMVPGAGPTADPNILKALSGVGVANQLPPDKLDGQAAVSVGLSGAAGATGDKPKESPYTDYSRIPCPEDGTELLGSSVTTSGKEPPFPVKLHKILSNSEYSDYISWLPHGRSWRVLKPKAFEEKVIPLFFRHAKYASFMRQVNGWGFKRMTQGPDHNSYYHELFLRGLGHLCHKMRRPARAKNAANEAEINPDFYRLSLVAPLPSNEPSPLGGVNQGMAGMQDLAMAQRGVAFPNMNVQGSQFGMAQANAPTFSNFPNLGAMGTGGNVMGGANGVLDNAAATNALLQQQLLQNQLQFAGNAGQPGIANFPAGLVGNGAGSLGDGSAELEALKNKREEILRQLNEFGMAGTVAPAAQSIGQDPSLLLNGPTNATPGNAQGMNGSMPQVQNMMQPNMVNNAGMQQLMASQLPGIAGDPSNPMQSGNVGAMGNGPGALGLKQFGMNGIPNNVLGGGLNGAPLNPGAAGINQQLLLQQQLGANGGNVATPTNGMGLPLLGAGMVNGLGAPGLGNLSGMMQNQFLPQMPNGMNESLGSQNAQAPEGTINNAGDGGGNGAPPAKAQL